VHVRGQEGVKVHIRGVYKLVLPYWKTKSPQWQTKSWQRSKS